MQITEKTQIDRFYKALLERDAAFVGQFFAAVKTTRIFCLPTCRARKPKPENTLFFTDEKGPLEAGFRACRVCRPLEDPNLPSEIVAKTLQLLAEKPTEKITDAELKNLGWSPEKVRRGFKKHFGQSFHAFQRSQKIEAAARQIELGKTISEVVFESGFESLSGFGSAFKKHVGAAPKTAKR